MAANKNLRLWPAFLFLIAVSALFGQEGYRIVEDGRFIQILRWQEQENVLYYELEIERQRESLWEQVLVEETEAVAFEVSLAPGNYRYRVRVYDFLGRPGPEAPWLLFEILAAKQPELSRFSPQAFYLDEDLAWTLNLLGRNLPQGTQIFLQNQSGRENIIRPRTVTVDRSEEEARLIFRYDQLDIGAYTIHVVNPGGLETSLENFRIAFRKPVDINVSAGYRPLVSLYGRINELLETRFYPLGAYARLGFVPFKRRWGYMGLELEPTWNYLHLEKENFETVAHLSGAVIYGVFQQRLPNRAMILHFRLGGGIYGAFDYHFIFSRGDTEPITVLFPVIAAGASFQWFVKKPFFVEAGLDFVHLFSKDSHSPGYLRPYLGAGWQF
ncbi:MAG: hypothetical protein LBQ46_02685 [Treponema sp.]|jgi:hypothetical protein|nr:hypothetical protein [Treponema sp.]